MAEAILTGIKVGGLIGLCVQMNHVFCDVMRSVEAGVCDVMCSDESGFCDVMCADESVFL